MSLSIKHEYITPKIIQKRLTDLISWQKSYESSIHELDDELIKLYENEESNNQLAIAIAQLKRQKKMELIQIPFEIDIEDLKRLGFNSLLEKFNHEYSLFSKDDQFTWLNNFLFVLTPEIKRLNQKLEKVKNQRRLGQTRNFLIGGNSGMGKTTFLDWYLWLHKPRIDEENRRNLVPIIKIDAPVDDKSGKPLLTRLINFCGKTTTDKLSYKQLLNMIVLLIQVCSTEMIILDEIEHIRVHVVKRRVLEISNLSPGIPIVCASCTPERWTDGDVEIKGRWNDSFLLSQYTGEKLTELLLQIEMMLPFPKPSKIWVKEIEENGQIIDGPASLIEKWTGGILRDIMALILDACRNAIEENLPNITPDQLEKSWRNIQESQVQDFLEDPLYI